MFYVIEYPNNAATIYAGRIVFAGIEQQCQIECQRLQNAADTIAQNRQQEANKANSRGVAATEVPSNEYTIVPATDWDGEFRRRRVRHK